MSFAVAHPIQGLIKYHGLRDRRLRLPYHDSISVCTAPLLTHTTVEFGHRVDSVRFGDRPASMEEMRRILEVVDALGEEAGGRSGMRMRTLNNFPSNIGLGASASGFAALAVAAAKAGPGALPGRTVPLRPPGSRLGGKGRHRGLLPMVCRGRRRRLHIKAPSASGRHRYGHRVRPRPHGQDH